MRTLQVLLMLIVSGLFLLTAPVWGEDLFVFNEFDPNASGVVEYQGIEPKSQQAFDELKSKAEQGDAESQFRLGWLYRNGSFVTQDYEQSFAWFSKAAAQNHIKAQAFLGNMYIRGQGTSKKYIDGTALIKKAAYNGDPDGQFYLAVLYMRGVGVPKRTFRALAWLDKAYKQNHVGAKGLLGFVLYHTAETSQDRSRGFMMMKDSCRQGDKLTCHKLREMFIRNIGE